VQLYIHDKVSSVTRPIKELKGFERVSLKPGEVRTVRFTITPESLQMWNDKMHRVVEPGEFEIMTGNSSVALQSTTLTVTP
ncbi:MAG TPA: beta-glucosidase, partial [Sphingobium sp.]|nr:beta-glucosidase [Sphingobium sp.]